MHTPHLFFEFTINLIFNVTIDVFIQIEDNVSFCLQRKLSGTVNQGTVRVLKNRFCAILRYEPIARV